MDASEGSWFIYGRFVKCGSDGTCLDSVTVYVDGYAIELLRGWVINQVIEIGAVSTMYILVVLPTFL